MTSSNGTKTKQNKTKSTKQRQIEARRQYPGTRVLASSSVARSNRNPENQFQTQPRFYCKRARDAFFSGKLRLVWIVVAAYPVPVFAPSLPGLHYVRGHTNHYGIVGSITGTDSF
eukprot:1768820-Rhodomonas_salina.1